MLTEFCQENALVIANTLIVRFIEVAKYEAYLSSNKQHLTLSSSYILCI